jgi:hypothetical protein
MTEQITIKLNQKKFEPLLNVLAVLIGKGITRSDSDLAAKCLFFCYYFLTFEHKEDKGKTFADMCEELSSTDMTSKILNFLKEYQNFQKTGLPPFEDIIKKVTKNSRKTRKTL